MPARPSFTVFCGPMMSSKTTRLLATVDRFRFQNLKVVAFKPKLDRRYTPEEISTHNGGKIPAITVSTGDEILRHTSIIQPDVVAVDEAFMIDGSADALISLFRQGVTIVVSSIEMSATCNVFVEIEKMLPWATKIEKCAAVCLVCGEDAFYTQRKIDDLAEIVVGGSELYEPRCWHHHNSAKVENI
jgi:thymidine kinase